MGDGELGLPGTRTFADAFANAIARRDVTLSALRTRLEDRGNPVSLATLSSWRSGTRTPDVQRSWAALSDLEDLLQLPAGDLVRLAAPRRAPTNATPARFLFDEARAAGLDMRIDDVVSELIRVLELAPQDAFRELSIQRIVDVDENLLVAREVTYSVVECVTGEVSRFGWLKFSDEPQFDGIGQITLDGHASEHHVDPSGRIHVTVFELEEPLAPGETTLLAVRQDIPVEQRSQRRETVTHVHHPAQKVVSWIRFDPRNVPERIEEFDRTETAEHTTLRVLDTPTSLHQVRWDYGPGALGLRWGDPQPADD